MSPSLTEGPGKQRMIPRPTYDKNARGNSVGLQEHTDGPTEDLHDGLAELVQWALGEIHSQGHRH